MMIFLIPKISFSFPKLSCDLIDQQFGAKKLAITSLFLFRVNPVSHSGGWKFLVDRRSSLS